MIQANNNTNPDASVNQIAETLTKNSSGIIVLPANPSVDAIAGATALYLGLTKMGKGVTLVCATSPQSDLTAADKIQQSIAAGGDNLVVSFPYSDGSIDKVDYNIQGTTFNLIIVPRQGFPKIKRKQVQFSYSGGKIEFIITVDAPNLNSLGAIYQQNQNQFQGQNLINIDRHLINNSFGLINYVNKTSSSTSELILKVLRALRVEIDKDIATNIYAGITAATNGFTSYSVNADTFECAAQLLKAGAVKKPMNKAGGNRPGMVGSRAPQGMPPAPMNNRYEEDYDDDFQMPPARPMPPQMAQQRGEQQAQQIEQVERENDVQDASSTPENWLKPKIFGDKGGLV